MRRVLTAAAIFQIAAAPPGQGRPPEAGAPELREERCLSAAQIYERMSASRLLLAAGEQAWIPGGYLGPSKAWG